jgi:hypothetical protein
MTATEPGTTTRPRTADTPMPLVCPECGEPARVVPPNEWPLAGWAPRPRFSHHDGTPLCPVVGPDGYTPAEPTGPADTDTPDPATATGSTATGSTSANVTDTTRDHDTDRGRTEGHPR